MQSILTYPVCGDILEEDRRGRRLTNTDMLSIDLHDVYLQGLDLKVLLVAATWA